MSVAPPGRAVAVKVRRNLSCLGEYLERGPDCGNVLLFHDRGKDIDSLRSVAAAAHAGAFNVLSIDLPEHGLSRGDYDSDVRSTIDKTIRSVRKMQGRAVACVVEGSTCQHVLSVDPGPAFALVLIRPPDVDLAGVNAGWLNVPKVIVTDSDQNHSNELPSDVGILSIRYFIHHDAISDELWNNQLKTIATKFLLEQWTLQGNYLQSTVKR